jgi:hypothetical protein
MTDRTRAGVVRVIVIGLWLLILGGGITAAALQSDSGVDPPPPTEPPSPLEATILDQKVGLVLDPPDGAKPAVTGEDAVEIAWREEGAAGDPTGVKATLALLTWGDEFQRTLVWVVTYEGACVIRQGPPGNKFECVEQPFHTLIDATTGRYIASYSSGT